MIEFDRAAQSIISVVAPALGWPGGSFTATAVADAIDGFARKQKVTAVALDGPQGWRDPATPSSLKGVGRRCEYECRTQAKTGVHPTTFPGNQRPWIELCVEIFDELARKPGVVVGNVGVVAPGTGYVILECFPTSAWRASALTPLPSKKKHPVLASYTAALRSAFVLPALTPGSHTHDDLQAAVAALTAMAFVGGPAIPIARGVPAAAAVGADGVSRRVEGIIWDARPLSISAAVGANAPPLAKPPSPSAGTAAALPAVYVSTSALAHANSTKNRSQMQIVLAGLPGGTKAKRIKLRLVIDDERYIVVVGDSHAAWRSHQTDETLDDFDTLFANLADTADERRALEDFAILP